MTPWVNEGFFADIAVLVEGEADRAAILAIAESMEHELPSMGVAVIPCGGKDEFGSPRHRVWRARYPDLRDMGQR